MLKNDEIEHLYGLYHDRVRRLAVSILHDTEEAKDVAGDIFARITDGRLRLPETKEEVYLLTTVRNLCLDKIAHLRVKERMMRQLTLETEPTTTSEDDRERRIERLWAYADTAFTPQTRRVFMLRFTQHKSYRDIAETLGISETAVYKHLAQALVKLKTFADNDE